MTKNIYQHMREYFGDELAHAPSYEQAFERAAHKFTKTHGVECPISYSAYRNKVWRERHKR